MKASTAERRWMENPVLPPSCVTPAGTSIEAQNEWEENTHTHTLLSTFSSTFVRNIPTFDHSSTLKRWPQTSVTAADLVWVCAPPRTIRKWLRRLAFWILRTRAQDPCNCCCRPGVGLRPAADHPQMVTTPGVLDPADPGARSLQLLLQTWCGSAPRRGPSANGYDAWRFGSESDFCGRNGRWKGLIFRHNRVLVQNQGTVLKKSSHRGVHPGHFPSREGENERRPISCAHSSWIKRSTLLCRKMTWVHPVVSFPQKIKTFRWEHRLYRQKLFMAFNRVPQ